MEQYPDWVSCRARHVPMTRVPSRHRMVSTMVLDRWRSASCSATASASRRLHFWAVTSMR